ELLLDARVDELGEVDGEAAPVVLLVDEPERRRARPRPDDERPRAADLLERALRPDRARADEEHAEDQPCRRDLTCQHRHDLSGRAEYSRPWNRSQAALRAPLDWRRARGGLFVGYRAQPGGVSLTRASPTPGTVTSWCGRALRWASSASVGTIPHAAGLWR